MSTPALNNRNLMCMAMHVYLGSLDNIAIHALKIPRGLQTLPQTTY